MKEVSSVLVELAATEPIEGKTPEFGPVASIYIAVYAILEFFGWRT